MNTVCCLFGICHFGAHFANELILLTDLMLQMSGTVRVIMRPLVNRIPIVAGITVYFLKQPVSTVVFEVMFFL